MQQFNKVRGTMEIVQSLEVNVDTVYVRSNVIKVENEQFVGWEYDEIQYGVKEYIGKISKQSDAMETDIASMNETIVALMTVGMPPM